MCSCGPPAYGQLKAGRPARTFIQQLCDDTGCNPEDLPKAMNDRETWRERVRDIRASRTSWWWWKLVQLNRTFGILLSVVCSVEINRRHYLCRHSPTNRFSIVVGEICVAHAVDYIVQSIVEWDSRFKITVAQALATLNEWKVCLYAAALRPFQLPLKRRMVSIMWLRFDVSFFFFFFFFGAY